MHSKVPGIALSIAALALAACGGGGGGYSPPGGGGGGVVIPQPPGVQALVIGLALPTGTIGVENDPMFGTVGGFTQQTYSQVLAFSPGASVKIQNLSSTTIHTLNVVGTVTGAPSFPANPALTTGAAGTPGTLDANFASGNIAPGASIGPLTLVAGTYYIGCAYHYLTNTMRTALVVAPAATPGPQATPLPSGTTPPGGGCIGNYC
jgi:hypothetical protein